MHQLQVYVETFFQISRPWWVDAGQNMRQRTTVNSLRRDGMGWVTPGP